MAPTELGPGWVLRHAAWAMPNTATKRHYPRIYMGRLKELVHAIFESTAIVILNLLLAFLIGCRPQAVKRAVALAHAADEAAQSHSRELSGVHTISVDVAD